MRRGEIEAVLAQGADAVVTLVRSFEARIDELGEQVEELKRRVGRDWLNSSMPPSSDPLACGAERKRKAREAYERSTRKTGGQPGHRGRTREIVAGERAGRQIPHLPGHCSCGCVWFARAAGA